MVVLVCASVIVYMCLCGIATTRCVCARAFVSALYFF